MTCCAAVVQLRDLRLLDPQLSTSYPSAILARDDALVLNLEFIKVGLELVIGSMCTIEVDVAFGLVLSLSVWCRMPTPDTESVT